MAFIILNHQYRRITHQSCSFQVQYYFENRPLRCIIMHRDLPAMRLHDGPAERQPNAQTTTGIRAVYLAGPEFIENMGPQGCRDPRPLIGHLEDGPAIVFAG
jgi:hypothetical protein